MQTRRTLLTAALAPAFASTLLSPVLLAVSPPARAALERLTPQQQADIARVEAYLNGIKTLQAHFFQVAGDGGTSQGTAWLERPGRMRFQYDPPAPYLLIASHGVLTFNDASLQQTSNIPLSRTPLGILLADKVTLTGAVTVTDIQRLPGQLQLTLVRTDSPGDGSLTLIFSDQPLVLRQWVVIDAQRRETHVTLSDIRLGGSFDPALFEQLAPPAARKG
ncbi:LolA family protein [Rhodopila sp.]|uniref:LolA family protein n=1 Tax=Rhodopila sp. TaxID=2480087 RepID=UPI002C8A4527|nr:outer membrane lipoprotein carrier protein LolA [Rhodopila sp.]HVZ06949.1 outer membrane lipoprotein carrier protein LolA [Rhodopila sp.]